MSPDFKESIGVLKGGLSRLTDPLADVSRENSGEIRTHTRVVDTVIRDGRVQG